MPPLYAMDHYEQCLLKPGDTYCLAEYDLSSKDHSDLLNYIQEFSEYKIKHFNHSHIYRATCVTSTCKHYVTDTLETSDLHQILERCLNESIWRDFTIEAKLAKINYCKKYEDKVNLDLSDYVVAGVYAVIMMCNIIGSFYDLGFCEKDSRNGNPYLLAFSMRRNWVKLIVPGGTGPDPRIARLKIFNGLRVTTMICVIFAHAALAMSYTYVENPIFIEKAYEDLPKQILFNGTLVTHTFFIMSSFLLSYNLQIQSEKKQITWVLIPKGILLRWLRLTPSYALIIATISTWVRYVGSGPLWDLIVISESNICRQYWWANIFYFNNYIYKDDFCFSPSWYLAADTQLFCLALTLFVIIQNPRYRNVILVLMFLASLIITASNTYFLDLDAIVIQSPEICRKIYTTSDTYNLIYIRGHTNLSTYVLGLAAGFFCYEWQTKEKDLSKLQKFRWVYWLGFPLGVVVILSGGIFYIDGYTPSTLVTVLYATLYKPVFHTLIVLFIIGSVFKFENLYRGILEWRGFTWAGRVCYSAFLVHTIFQRTYIGTFTTNIVLTDYYVLTLLFSSVLLSFTCGAVLWLCVEAPVAGLMKALFAPKSNK